MWVDGLQDGTGGGRAHLRIAEGVLVLIEEVDKTRLAGLAGVLRHKRAEAIGGSLKEVASSGGGSNAWVIRARRLLTQKRLRRELLEREVYRAQLDFVRHLSSIEEILSSLNILAQLGGRFLSEFRKRGSACHLERLLVALDILASYAWYLSQEFIASLPLAFIDFACLFDVEDKLSQLRFSFFLLILSLNLHGQGDLYRLFVESLV